MDIVSNFRGDTVSDSFPIVKLATITRFLTWILAIIFDKLIDDHEYSTELFLQNSQIKFFVQPLMRWDALFFIDIAQRGYEFSKNHAFFPGYPLIIRCFSPLLQVLGFNQTDSTILGALCISNLCFVVAAWVLYK